MLKVELEPKEFGQMGLERCVFCREKTSYWYKKQVALCPTCAKKAKRSQVPDKRAWCAAMRYMPWYDKLAKHECGKCGGMIGVISSLSDVRLGLFALGCVSGGHVQSFIDYNDPSIFPKRAK